MHVMTLYLLGLAGALLELLELQLARSELLIHQLQALLVLLQLHGRAGRSRGSGTTWSRASGRGCRSRRGTATRVRARHP